MKVAVGDEVVGVAVWKDGGSWAYGADRAGLGVGFGVKVTTYSYLPLRGYYMWRPVFWWLLHIGIDYDEIETKSKAETISLLLDKIEKQGIFSKLLQFLKATRPDVFDVITTLFK